MFEGLTIGRRGDPGERVEKSGTSLELLTSHEGIEISRQTIIAGRHFFLLPAEEWEGFEFIYVLRGQLVHVNPVKGDVLLTEGDFFHHDGLPERAFFRAEEDVELLMLSSTPSFHVAQTEIRDMVSMARAVEEKDQETQGHSRRLERLAIMTGERLGLASEELIDLSFGAFLHDVGKVRIPDEILDKRDSLTDQEWRIMRKHPEYGARMLEQKTLLRGAAKIVHAHHERYDGSGYPRGLKGDEIPIGARVVAVVDAYDAVTSSRPYRDAQAVSKAIEELRRGSGSQFDPRVVEAFIKAIGETNVLETKTDEAAL